KVVLARREESQSAGVSDSPQPKYGHGFCGSSQCRLLTKQTCSDALCSTLSHRAGPAYDIFIRNNASFEEKVQGGGASAEAGWQSRIAEGVCGGTVHRAGKVASSGRKNGSSLSEISHISAVSLRSNRHVSIV
ncbi:unnamed protein product, partial [Amoebophrya sp. A25]